MYAHGSRQSSGPTLGARVSGGPETPLRQGELPLRLTAAGPETQDTDFTWAEFIRRNNDELVATWGERRRRG